MRVLMLPAYLVLGVVFGTVLGIAMFFATLYGAIVAFTKESLK